MSLTLPSELTAEKNKLHTTSAWLWFCAITLPDSTVLRRVRNTEDVVFGGETYIATYFKISGLRASADAGIPQVMLSVADPGRIIRDYINDNSGLEDCDVVLTRVNSKNLDSDYSELEYTCRIAGYDDDDLNANFTLGAPNLLNRRFPLHELTAELCDHVFTDPYCAYSGSFTTCDGTVPQCVERDNIERFGGELAIQDRMRIIV